MDLEQFLLDISSEMQGMLTETQTIKLVYSGERKVWLDPKLLRNILFNLISNAIKFSPGEAEVALDVRVSGQELSLSVKDQGIGISEEDQRHLFERFFRGGNATHIQGTGLGLNIVSKYVELMNGKVAIQSAQNEGTTVTLTIPF